MFDVKEWIYDGKRIPEWVNEQAARGIIKITKEDGEIVEVKLFTTSGPMIVNRGDVVILLKSGVVKLTREQYEKFMNKNNNVVKKG